MLENTTSNLSIWKRNLHKSRFGNQSVQFTEVWALFVMPQGDSPVSGPFWGLNNDMTDLGWMSYDFYF